MEEGYILGEALGADDEEVQVLGTPPLKIVHAHLRKIANLIGQDCLNIQHPLPEHLVPQEAGMQLGFALLQRTLPSRILHLLRGQAVDLPQNSARALPRKCAPPCRVGSAIRR